MRLNSCLGVTSESTREFISQFGKAVDVTAMLDREMGRSKGFGFEGVSVEPTLESGNLQIDGKLSRRYNSSQSPRSN